MKSHASGLTKLALCIYKDACAECVALEPDQRDTDTLVSRVKHEGLSFLTITLPTFGADFDRSLAEGRVAPHRFSSFKKIKGGTIPAFLQGMFAQVFDRFTGKLLQDPSVSSIRGIRQLTYAFKKVKLPCSPERNNKAFEKFHEVEHELELPLDSNDIDYFLSVSDLIWGTVLGHNIDVLKLLPKHGPGATAEKIHGNMKYSPLIWHDRLEPYFPLLGYAFPNENAYQTRGFEKVSVIDRESEQPVRVITVPKTLKSPRIIAIEPVCMQYTQQAIAKELVTTLENHELTKGHVNFTDQSVNRDLAMSSSEDSQMATLDMSSASDRVPLSLVTGMLRQNQDLLGAVLACRSMKAQTPKGLLVLRKFASMGSALCFPIEAMYFYTICVGSLLKAYRLPVTYRNILYVSRYVYVYGDDIIVPTNSATIVSAELQKYYCRVSSQKSYWTGKFRESCGMDAYDGREVTPTYIRHERPRNKRSASSIISWVETSNLFFKRGYYFTSSHMMKVCESIIGNLPIIGDDCAGLGKWSDKLCLPSENRCLHTPKYRWNRRYQVNEVFTWVASPVYRKDKLTGHSALLKCLLNMEHRKSSDVHTRKDHLSRTARHGAVTLKRRWVQPRN